MKGRWSGEVGAIKVQCNINLEKERWRGDVVAMKGRWRGDGVAK
jgi:hypothetical protein